MKARGADIIAQKLAGLGCEDAFGIPGGEVLTLIDAFREAGIAFNLTKHENVAGFMAEGTWHATGAPGILVATLGPGVANAVNSVANAHQDRVPLLFITGCIDGAVAHRYTHQVFDHQAMLRPIVKASLRAEKGAVEAVIDKAIAIMLDGQPGPVHIDLPIAVAESEEEGTGRLARPAPSIGGAPTDAVSDLKAVLENSEKPVAIAGVDALNEGAGEAIAEFCKAWSIPLITSYKGKGLLPETDALALGGAGLSPKADEILLPFVNTRDLILILGYDPIEMRIGWRDPWPMDRGPKVIEITPVERSHGMHRVDETLRASVGETLRQLGSPREKRAPDSGISTVRSALSEAFEPTGSWGPAQVFDTLRKALPEDSVSTADSGAHRILVSHMWTCHAPRTMLQSSALCTMGCAVPIAAGYKLKRPETPVIAFIGDAGLEMILGDLATLRDMQIPVIICVICDESLALIEKKQRGMQLPNSGVYFGATDFPGVANSMGGHGVWIDDVETLKAEAAAALKRDTFTVLAARVPRWSYDGLF